MTNHSQTPLPERLTAIQLQHPPDLLTSFQSLGKMSHPPPQPTFVGLPTELKTKVFSYIAGKADRKAMTLVSYECNKVMAPIQWYTLTLKVGSKPSGELDILLYSGNNILRHVHQLNIKNGVYRTPAQRSRFDFDGIFKLIIFALPENNLRCFQSDTHISPHLIRCLFLTQNALQELSFNGLTLAENPGAPTSRAEVAAYVAPALLNVKKLTISIKQWDCNKYEDSAQLITHTPKLEFLHLHSKYSTVFVINKRPGLDALGGPFALGQEPKKLAEFHLESINCGEVPSSLLEFNDYSVLRFLSITRCHYLDQFFNGLSKKFAQACALISLKIVLPVRGFGWKEDITQLVELLLISITSPLQSIELDMGSNQMVHGSSLAKHSPSLESLTLTATQSMQEPAVSPDSILKIRESAPNLKDLKIGPRYYLKST